MAFIRETSTTGVDESVSGALAVTGLLTATAGIKLGNNIIYASDGGSTITLDTSDNVIIAGDLQVSGNDIKNSDGETTISMTATQDVSIAGDLTVTGGKLTFGNGEIFHNETDDVLYLIAPTVGINAVLHSRDALFALIADADRDSELRFMESTANKWSIGHDASAADQLCFMQNASINEATAKMKLETDGDLIIAGDFTANGGDVTIVAAEATDATLTLKTDESDDAGDDWQLLVDYQSDSANKFHIGNDIASAGTIVSLISITPHATAASSLVAIVGDLEVNGGRITFENDEYIHNENNGVLELVATTTLFTGSNAKLESASGDDATFTINASSGAAGRDGKIQFQENDVNKWYMGFDGSESNDDFYFGGGSDITADRYMSFSTINSTKCVQMHNALYVGQIKSNTSITITPDANADGGTTEAFKVAKDTGTTKFTVTEDGQCTVALGVQCTAVAHTATDDGTGTGTIAAGTSVVSVNANSDANHIIILPAPVVGNIIHLIETSTTGYELRSSTPASIGINGGTASNGESAIAGAITYIKCVCVSSTNWICSQFDADGDETKVEAAA